jgi:DNA-3-methyladenine glycosylase
MREALSLPFFERPTLQIARDLLGRTLWRRTEEGIVGGIIVETEAYISAIDPASHNYLKPRKRSMMMFGPPGYAYIYFTYGMYHCLNVVTESEGVSAAVLIRAIEPTYGLDLIVQRRPKVTDLRDLARGPGRVCLAFALTTENNGTLLQSESLWLSETPDRPEITDTQVLMSPRIGISQGIDRLWRYFLIDNPFVSGKRRLDVDGVQQYTRSEEVR